MIPRPYAPPDAFARPVVAMTAKNLDVANPMTDQSSPAPAWSWKNSQSRTYPLSVSGLRWRETFYPDRQVLLISEADDNTFEVHSLEPQAKIESQTMH